ncbi:MAG: hypothetical protein LBR06_00640, partial [Bacteroidales bacterium]|nr:hypothetical protein [Bacteroidales bacterium]
MLKRTFLLLFAALSTAVTGASKGSFSLYDLTCEQQTNPLAVETQAPCLSWKLFSSERGFVQSA